MGKMDELIIVAPRREIFDEETHAFHGFLPVSDSRLEAILGGLCASPREARRGDVEEDPAGLHEQAEVADGREPGPQGPAGVGDGPERLHRRVVLHVVLERLTRRSRLRLVREGEPPPAEDPYANPFRPRQSRRGAPPRRASGRRRSCSRTRSP